VAFVAIQACAFDKAASLSLFMEVTLIVRAKIYFQLTNGGMLLLLPLSLHFYGLLLLALPTSIIS
jgi:hypothetical protein